MIQIDQILVTRKLNWLVILLSAGAIIVTCLPYAIGASQADGRLYMGCLDGVPDYSVYLAWMRQGAEGHLFASTLYSPTGPPILVNPFYFTIGAIGRLINVDTLATFQVARVICGAGMIAAFWALCKLLVNIQTARLFALITVLVSGGLGWIGNTVNGIQPIDRWQTEAFGFLSLLYSPHILFAEMLQLIAIYSLIRAERTSQSRFAVLAGICGLVLGFTHTYDCVSLAAVWIVYLIARSVRGDRKQLIANLKNTSIAAVITLPGVLYIVYQLHSNPVFSARSSVPTPSPSIFMVLEGFGLPMIFAVLAIIINKRKNATSHKMFDRSESFLLLTTWMIVNIAVSYAPVFFQRKLLQGAQFPVDILAGVWLASAFSNGPQKSKQRMASVVGVTLCVIATMITPYISLVNDIRRISTNADRSGYSRFYLQRGEVSAMQWIDVNTSKLAVVQPLPWINMEPNGGISVTDTTLATFAPSLTGRHVYAGHWGETPDAYTRFNMLAIFGSSLWADQDRQSFLRQSGINYIVYSQTLSGQTPPMQFRSMFSTGASLPPYLKLVYANQDASVYKVKL